MATYYMREDGTAANKESATGPGSVQSACMNVAVHNGETFSPGDVILVCDDGGTITSRIRAPSSGSSGNVVTYEPEPGDSPIVDSIGGAFEANGDDYLLIQNLELAGGTYPVVLNGVGLTLRNCVVRDGSEDCILVDGSGIAISDLLIEGCTVTGFIGGESGGAGILVTKNGGTAPQNVTIQDNIFYDNGTDTSLDHDVYIKGANGFIVRRNLSYNCVATSIVIADESANGDVGQNVCTANKSGISVSGVIATGSNILIHHNLCYENTIYGAGNGIEADGIEWYGNTFVNNGWASMKIGDAPAGPQDCIFKNNIFWQDYDVVGGSHQPLHLQYASLAADNTFDYNSYYHNNPAAPDDMWKIVDAGTTLELSEWQALTGSPGVHSIVGDALFLNVSSNDYHLQSGSPCIEAGTPIAGLLTDFDGVPLGRGTNPDIGCYETLKGGPRNI